MRRISSFFRTALQSATQSRRCCVKTMGETLRSSSQYSVVFFSMSEINKWSKNFDERPHRPTLLTPVAGESILKPLFRRNALRYHLWTSLQPRVARRFLLTQFNAFQKSNYPRNCPIPWITAVPRLIHGSLGPPESTTHWRI